MSCANVIFPLDLCEASHYPDRMESTSQQLVDEMERAAAALGLAPSTIGREAGQGGRFYARIKAGARVWPETRAKVMATIAQLERGQSTAPPTGAQQ